MKEKQKIASDLNKAFRSLKDNMAESFEHIKNNPQDRDEIINMWKEYIKKLLQTATAMSQKYKDKGIIKAVTKMLMFGR